MNSTQEPIIIQQEFRASPEKLWTALTQPIAMKQWYFNQIQDFKPEVGFETSFTVQLENKTYPHHWKITEVVPEKRIAYEWTFKGYPGKALTIFEISKAQELTVLTLTSLTPEPFDTSIPEFKRESGVQGWKYLIHDQLVSYLDL